MVDYTPFAKTFSESRKSLSWPELDYIIADMKQSGFSSVLDIGCGNGRFVEYAQKNTLPLEYYLGIDSSLGMIEQAQILHPEARFLVSDMQRITLEANRVFDAIVFLASFHHLETEASRLQTLKNILPYLSIHGKIYMTNWNLRAQERYQKCHLGNGNYSIKIGAHSRYYHGFTLQELEDIFREAEVTLIENTMSASGRNIISILKKQ